MNTVKTRIIQSQSKAARQAEPHCQDKGHERFSTLYFPAPGGGTGNAYKLALSISRLPSPFSFSFLVVLLSPLKFSHQLSSERHSRLEGEGGRCYL